MVSAWEAGAYRGGVRVCVRERVGGKLSRCMVSRVGLCFVPKVGSSVAVKTTLP